MTTAIETKFTAASIEAMPDFEGISRRFLQDFEAFVQQKKVSAVKAVLKQELSASVLSESENLVQAIVANLDEEALLEKRYIFLSVNAQCLV